MRVKGAIKGVAGGVLSVLERAAGRQDTEASEAREVLLLLYMLPLGCCVHLTPVFEAIKTGRPEVRLTVATRGLGAELLRHDRYVDRVIVTADPLKDLPAAVRSLRSGLRRLGLRPEWVMTGASDLRTRIAMMAVGAGGTRAGFTLAAPLYRRWLDYDKGLSLIDNNLRLAELLGASGVHREPRVFFSRAEAGGAGELLREANPEGRPVLVAVTQGSGGQRTGWHAERFAEVVRMAAEELRMAVVYVGTAADGAGIEQIRLLAGGVGRSVAGRTTVTELAALLAMSDAMVTLDTGTMHVGRAVGVPMVVLGPSWQRPLEWLPLGLERVRILRGEDKDTVPEGYRLDEVGAAEVMGALRGLMAEFPPQAGERAGRVERGMSDVELW